MTACGTMPPPCVRHLDEVNYPLLLLSFGVPLWLVTLGFGRNDMYWQRLVERWGRNSLVGTTVRDPKRLPQHVAADEHHAAWCGEKGYVPLTAGEGCLLGIALTEAADDDHLRDAYSTFRDEARNVDPAYTPKTVNTDGGKATQNAWRGLLPLLGVILCFLYGFLKIRDRIRKDHELHRRIWGVYRAATSIAFAKRMRDFRRWWQGKSWAAPVREALEKLWNHRLNRKKYHDHWLHNLQISASMAGHRQST